MVVGVFLFVFILQVVEMWNLGVGVFEFFGGVVIKNQNLFYDGISE